jgi:hypothetical protein
MNHTPLNSSGLDSVSVLSVLHLVISTVGDWCSVSWDVIPRVCCPKTVALITSVDLCFRTVFHIGTLTLIFLIPKTATYGNRNSTTKYKLKYEMTKTKRDLVAQGDYSSTANKRTKIPAVFRRIFENFCHILTFFVHKSTIFLLNS